MISFLSFVYLLYGLSAFQSEASPPKNTGANILDPKPLMCKFKGNMDLASKGLLKLEVKDIPAECGVIVYTRFSINLKSKLDVDKNLLQQVVALKKPVILQISHEEGYSYFSSLLKPNKQYEQTKVLREFAVSNNLSGILIENTYPALIYDTLNEDIGPNLQHYMSQLKGDSNLIIGLIIPALPVFIRTPCIYKFADLNAIVDFYEVSSFALNECKPGVFNGIVPVKKSQYGQDYYLGLDEVAEIVLGTDIDKNKLVYVLQLAPVDNESQGFVSYHRVCTNKFNTSEWCIQNTNNYFMKGSFARLQKAGCDVMFMELDDINDECGCGKFIGLKNIAAGFQGGKAIPCPKYDVQKTNLQ